MAVRVGESQAVELFVSPSFNLVVAPLGAEGGENKKQDYEWWQQRKPFARSMEKDFDLLFPPIEQDQFVKEVGDVNNLPFQPNLLKVRFDGALTHEVAPYFTTYRLHKWFNKPIHSGSNAMSVLKHEIVKRVKPTAKRVLMRHAVDGFSYIFNLKPSAIFMNDKDLYLEVENSMKNLGAFGPLRKGFDELDYSSLFSPKSISFLEMPCVCYY